MKLTKKAAALLLAASLAVSVCATPVFAAEMGSKEVEGKSLVAGGSLEGSWGTHVLYNVTESYTWTVPVTIDFGENAGENNTSTVNATLEKDKNGSKADNDGTGKWKGTAPKIVVTKNVIRADKKLQITVDTNKHFATSFDSTGGFYVVTSDTHEKLYYTITKPAAGGTGEKLTEANNVVLLVDSGTNTANQELVFELETAKGENAAEKAGSYEGYVFFSSSIID